MRIVSGSLPKRGRLNPRSKSECGRRIAQNGDGVSRRFSAATRGMPAPLGLAWCVAAHRGKGGMPTWGSVPNVRHFSRSITHCRVGDVNPVIAWR